MREFLIDPFMEALFPHTLGGIAEDNFAEAKRTNGDVLLLFGIAQSLLLFFYIDHLVSLNLFTIYSGLTDDMAWWKLVYPGFGFLLFFINLFWRWGSTSNLAGTADMTQIFIYMYQGIMALGLVFALLMQNSTVESAIDGAFGSFDLSVNASEWVLMFLIPSIQAFSFLNLAEAAQAL